MEWQISWKKNEMHIILFYISKQVKALNMQLNWLLLSKVKREAHIHFFKTFSTIILMKKVSNISITCIRDLNHSFLYLSFFFEEKWSLVAWFSLLLVQMLIPFFSPNFAFFPPQSKQLLTLNIQSNIFLMSYTHHSPLKSQYHTDFTDIKK